MTSWPMERRIGIGAGWLVAGAIVLTSVLAVAASRATDAEPSHYAPARDLESQMKTLVEQLHKNLATPTDYEDKQKDGVEKDANTVAVAALVLDKHDQTNGVQKSAKAVVQAATALAKNAGDFTAAKAALAKLDAAFKVSDSDEMAWQSVGDIRQLMLQVPILNTNLRRAVNGRRFATSRDKAAALTATLAAIAQVSIFDDTYCSDEAEQTKWTTYCVAMREAAAGCNKAIHANEPDNAKEMLKKIMVSCDECHAVFQD